MEIGKNLWGWDNLFHCHSQAVGLYCSYRADEQTEAAQTTFCLLIFLLFSFQGFLQVCFLFIES